MAGKSKKKSVDEIPKNMTLLEASDFWDKHSLLDYEGVKDTEFEIDIQYEEFVFSLKPELAHQIFALAEKKGISSHTLIQDWLQEKVASPGP
ncbi:MAG: hypothetical protein HY731_06350 [Candidatus Tectomicrobia bacterium]|nr:hypothetical protein [Candidatus Tectomicrobia bacterium]